MAAPAPTETQSKPVEETINDHDEQQKTKPSKDEDAESKESDPEYELYYWKGIGGRGTPIRLCLAICGVTWTEKFREGIDTVMGPNINGFPNFAVPILKHGDIIISQTPAICVYVMEKYGFVPDDPLQRIYALQVTLTVADALSE
eukprot:341493_1